MGNLPTTKRVILNTRSLAEQIEDSARPYLASYPAGFYDPTSRRPVLSFGETYYIQGAHGFTKVNISKPEDIVSNIYDINGRKLVSFEIRKFITPLPQFPIHGAAMIEELAQCVINEMCVYNGKAPAAKVEDLWNDFLSSGATAPDVNLKSSIHELLAETSRQVREFIGDDRWVIHFCSTLSGDLLIEKSIDWRIWDWEKRMSTGEWS